MTDFVELIARKKAGRELSTAEIEALVRGVTDDSIPDYQLAAFLMAVCWRGLTEREVLDLTRAMADSGERADLSGVEGITVDKHSTGGVSDSTTLVLLPVLALAGLKVVKASGRGLGHTGGTLDKIESFPGFRVDLSREERIAQANRVGAVLCGAGEDLAPADKKLYALRDVTATVDSLPLICASVMSKKLAGGAGILLMDVKYGSGAFLKTYDEAEALAKLMTKVGREAGRVTDCLISSMEQPLTPAVGCHLEVREALKILHGSREGDLYAVSKALAEKMFALAGLSADFDGLIAGGKAVDKMAEIVRAQGGDPAAVFEPERLLPSPCRREILAGEEGFAAAVDTRAVGHCCCLLGGGREKKGDPIDRGAGLMFFPRLGGFVKMGEKIAELYAADPDKLDAGERALEKALTLSAEPVAVPPLFGRP